MLRQTSIFCYLIIFTRQSSFSYLASTTDTRIQYPSLNPADPALPNLHSESNSTKSTNLHSTTFPSSSNIAASSNHRSPSALHDYHQFHANDSLIGMLIPCTYDEKVCLRQNKILDPEKNVCLPSLFDIESYLPVHKDHKVCKLDRNEFEYGSGHLTSICTKYISFEDHYDELPCEGLRMAYDGKCYSHDTIRDVICGCEAPPTRHIFGDYECRCSQPTPIEVQQPEEDRLCRIPDFRFPKKPKFEDIASYNLTFHCSDEQSKCFSEGKVWMPQGQGCFSAFSSGPCSSNYAVGLNADAAKNGLAEGKCVHVRGECPLLQKRIVNDNVCYPERDFEVVGLQRLSQNIFGTYEVMHILMHRYMLLSKSDNGSCFIEVNGALGAVFNPSLPRPACPQTDRGQSVCSFYVSSLPKPGGF